jgi:hypothetical protein
MGGTPLCGLIELDVFAEKIQRSINDPILGDYHIGVPEFIASGTSRSLGQSFYDM